MQPSAARAVLAVYEAEVRLGEEPAAAPERVREVHCVMHRRHSTAPASSGRHARETKRLNGHYRLERDSIFLDQDTDGGTKLAFAGRASGDTIDVHWIPTTGQRSNNGHVELVFVRAK